MHVSDERIKKCMKGEDASLCTCLQEKRRDRVKGCVYPKPHKAHTHHRHCHASLSDIYSLLMQACKMRRHWWARRCRAAVKAWCIHGLWIHARLPLPTPSALRIFPRWILWLSRYAVACTASATMPESDAQPLAPWAMLQPPPRTAARRRATGQEVR